MVHVRTVDGEPEIFGNQGALFMNAMTWWDHSTESVWSQVWGRAIEGPLTGTELTLLPSQVLPWGAWREQYPESLLLSTGSPRFSPSTERAIDYYVIDVTLDDTTKAYPYEAAAQAGVINDQVGNVPIAVVVNTQTRGA
jgi:hypothetical protein